MDASMSDEGLDQPLAEHRGRQELYQLPMCYWDILPKPPPALENCPDQHVAVEQESNDVVLAMLHEVRFMILVQPITH